MAALSSVSTCFGCFEPIGHPHLSTEIVTQIIAELFFRDSHFSFFSVVSSDSFFFSSFGLITPAK